MKNTSDTEKIIRKYYENLWSKPSQIMEREKNPLLGFHYGLYTDGIKNWKDAAINMNNFVGQYFDFKKNRENKILDAGCGIGSTALYLAIKHPSTKFYGISIAPTEIKYAKKIQIQRRINNCEFVLGNFIETNFPDNFFDGVYALESFCYAEDKIKFLKEMGRILKSGGKLVILDGFKQKEIHSSFMNKLYNSFLSRREIRYLLSLDELNSNLENEEFKDIIIKNLSKENGFVFNFIQLNYPLIVIKYLSDQLKKIILRKNYKTRKDMDYVWGALVPELILGINKIIGYYAISTIKK